MRSQTYGDVHRGDRSVRRHRLRLAALAAGTAGGLVTLFHYDGAVPVGAPPASGAAGDPGLAAAAPAAEAPAARAQAPAAGDGSPPGRGAEASGSEASGRGGASAGRPAARTVLGDPANTRWGVVQVKIAVRDGRVTSAVAVRSPRSTERSVQINARALPILGTEAVQAQNGQVDAVSGATVTSEGYQASLQSALDKAQLG